MNFFQEFLSSGGKISSKRVATAISLIFYLIFAGCEQFLSFKANPAYMEGLMYIVISGLGLTASEKFSKQSKVKVDEQTLNDFKG